MGVANFIDYLLFWGGGLDDWEVKIADFVVLLGKDAKKVFDAANRAKGLWGIRLRCRNWGLTPAIIL